MGQGGVRDGLKRVDEYLEAALDLIGDDPKKRTAIGEWLVALAPWAEKTTELAGDLAPPIKFVLAIWKEARQENDPQKLGALAFTVAYQHAIEQSLEQVLAERAIKQGRLEPLAPVQKKEKKLEPMPVDYDYTSASLEDVGTHPFVEALPSPTGRLAP